MQDQVVMTIWNIYHSPFSFFAFICLILVCLWVYMCNVAKNLSLSTREHNVTFVPKSGRYMLLYVVCRWNIIYAVCSRLSRYIMYFNPRVYDHWSTDWIHHFRLCRIYEGKVFYIQTTYRQILHFHSLN